MNTTEVSGKGLGCHRIYSHVNLASPFINIYQKIKPDKGSRGEHWHNVFPHLIQHHMKLFIRLDTGQSYFRSLVSKISLYLMQDNILYRRILSSCTLLPNSCKRKIFYSPIAKTSQVINKFSLKLAQPHATYLPGLVWKYIFGLTPLIFR